MVKIVVDDDEFYLGWATLDDGAVSTTPCSTYGHARRELERLASRRGMDLFWFDGEVTNARSGDS